MYTTFDEITQPFIRTTLSKNNTSVLELRIFYETGGDIPNKYPRVLSFIV